MVIRATPLSVQKLLRSASCLLEFKIFELASEHGVRDYMPSGLDWIGLPSNSATKSKLTPERFTMVLLIS